ncbi:MAG: GbsR/MarR family transcriptional regulator [Candidatus Brocadiia bacterium]
MTEETDPIRDRFIHEMGELASDLGLNKSVGQIYALLYMNPDPMSLSDIADACQMSKGNASMNVRELERWGAARKACVPGDRKDYYEANRDVPEIVIDRLQNGLTRRMDAMRRVIDNAEEDLESVEDKQKRRFYRERLQDVRDLDKKVDKALKNLDKVYGLVRRFF